MNKWVVIGISLILVALVIWAVASGGITGNVITASVVGGEGMTGEAPVADGTSDQVGLEEVFDDTQDTSESG